MVHNGAVLLVLSIVLLSLAFWWGRWEGGRADIARVKGGKDG